MAQSGALCRTCARATDPAQWEAGIDLHRGIIVNRTMQIKPAALAEGIVNSLVEVGRWQRVAKEDELGNHLFVAKGKPCDPSGSQSGRSTSLVITLKIASIQRRGRVRRASNNSQRRDAVCLAHLPIPQLDGAKMERWLRYWCHAIIAAASPCHR